MKRHAFDTHNRSLENRRPQDTLRIASGKNQGSKLEVGHQYPTQTPAAHTTIAYLILEVCKQPLVQPSSSYQIVN